MNERIEKLAEQAEKYADDNFKGEHFWTQAYESKFAELIVKECVSIGDNYQDILGDKPECFNCRKVAYGIVDKIREHFGVEE